MNDDTDQSGADDPVSNEPVTIGKRDLQQLRRAANTAANAQKELDGLKRQMAFVGAGINPEDKRLSYFVKGYEGDMTSDAIKAAAIEAGFLAGEQEQGPPPGMPGQMQQVGAAYEPSSYEMSAMTRANSATGGTSGAFVTNDAAYFTALNTAMQQGPQAVLDVMKRFNVPTPGMD